MRRAVRAGGPAGGGGVKAGGLTVVVAGGGIAGLTFAGLMRRAPNVKKIVVLEQQKQQRNGGDFGRRRDENAKKKLGAGIALWPTAQAVLGQLPVRVGSGDRGVVDNVADVLAARDGRFLPENGVFYADPRGDILARPGANFGTRIPVLALRRDDLLGRLEQSCAFSEEQGGSAGGFAPVVRMDGAKVAGLELLDDEGESSANAGRVRIHLEDNRFLHGDILVGADGLHSCVRDSLLPLCGEEPDLVSPAYCGYTYFRATRPVDDSQHLDVAFETWGDGARLGYVPLRSEAFWFVSVPNSSPGDRSSTGQGVDDETKAWLVDRFAQWRGPAPLSATRENPFPTLDLGKLIADTPAEAVLRTDIFKIPDVTGFPWSSPCGRVVLLGDSAHATAPNLAQGAGLCIEDAAILSHQLSRSARLWQTPVWDWELASSVNAYVRQRVPRARTVQSMADQIATAGQQHNSSIIKARNGIMSFGIDRLPRVAEGIFEAAVSHSLGGSWAARELHPTWLPPSLSAGLHDKFFGSEQSTAVSDACEWAAGANRSLLGRVVGRDQFMQLPSHVREFRAARDRDDIRCGTGSVTVGIPRSNAAAFAAWLLKLPPAMSERPFAASVRSFDRNRQRWTRVFDAHSSDSAEFSTTHRIERSDRQRGVCLTEGIGGFFDSALRFEYDVDVVDGGSAVHYSSAGMRLFGFRLPLPARLLPRSRWVERPTDSGWKFEKGELQLPLVGQVMAYDGEFSISVPGYEVSRPGAPHDFIKGRAIVMGGSGLVGRSVCAALGAAGYEVVILSRQAAMFSPSKLPRGVQRVVQWDGFSGTGWAELLDENSVVVNLAGTVPSAVKWDQALKDAVLDSRLDAIDAIDDAFSRVSEERRPRMVLQASAAGWYGNRGDEVLDDRGAAPATEAARAAEVVPGTSFRMNTVEAVEKQTRAVLQRGKTHVTMLRLGHVASHEGGLFPHLIRAASFGVGAFGSGDQFVPWVHIDDVGRSVAHICGRDIPENAYNIAAPNSATQKEVMRNLAGASLAFSTYSTRIPASLVRYALGDSSAVLLDSERLAPANLQREGFKFRHADLGEALADIKLRQKNRS